MALFTSNYLRNKYSATLIAEQKRQFSSIDKSKLKFDIFLSHSYLDKEEVLGLYRELTEMGFSVYVDWIIDADLDRTNVTKATAEIIKSRMKNSKSLLLAISTNASMSKWMPWELGFVDGNTDRCVIVPISKDNNLSFNRVEYLKLYPYLDITNGNLWVNEDAKSYISFRRWINGENPTKRN
ncbi:toll/interleukin-1 receptor domain-containing protein [Flavobacterium sp. DGU38]|uniref:Toll/interleukin-1 receptor domain-containing protein n=1 Tax=Flavobacterium calami TaxID=3139144 RepID=A0ABU9IV80_9FLAO